MSPIFILYWIFFVILVAWAIQWYRQHKIDESFYQYGIFFAGAYILLRKYIMPDIDLGSIELEIFVQEAILFFMAAVFFTFWEPVSQMSTKEAIACAIGYQLAENIFYIAILHTPIWGGFTLIRLFSIVMISQAVSRQWNLRYAILGFLAPLLPFLVLKAIFIVATRQYYFEIRMTVTAVLAAACLMYLKQLINKNHLL